MFVSNKRLKLIYPGRAIHSACEAHVSFKMERGFLCGPGKEGQVQKRSGEGPSGFCFSWGAIKTLIFNHTWCFFFFFLWQQTPDAAHQLGNQRYQAGWRFTERSSAYCLTATLNIHPHRQIICCLLNHPSIAGLAGIQLRKYQWFSCATFLGTWGHDAKVTFSLHYIQVRLDTPAESNFLVWINCGSSFLGVSRKRWHFKRSLPLRLREVARLWQERYVHRRDADRQK